MSVSAKAKLQDLAFNQMKIKVIKLETAKGKLRDENTELFERKFH